MALLLAPVSDALAKDKEFKAVTKHIEKNYQARRTRIPFLGLAGVAVKLIRPAGVKGFKLAIYEGRDFSPRPGELSFKSVMSQAYTKGWTPLAQMNSKRDGSSRVYAYARPNGKDVTFAVVVFEHNEAIVAEVKVNPDKVAQFIENPRLLGISLGGLKGSNPTGGLPGIAIASGARTSAPAAGATGAGAQAVSARRRESKYSADLSVLENGESAKPADGTPPVVSAPPETTPPATAPSGAATETAKRTDAGETDENPPPPASTADTGKAKNNEAIRVETRLVNLNVRAVAANGLPISNLKQQDFVVYEDGVRQEIAHFAPVNAPISLVMLLDLSGSTEKKIKDMKAAATRFVDALSGDTQIAVGTFSGKFRLATPFVTDKAKLRQAIDSIEHKGGGTEYFRAMGTSLDLLRKASHQRRVIVVLTDGVDNVLQWNADSDLPEYREMARRISAEEVTVYPIYFDTENKLGRLSMFFGNSGNSGKRAGYVVARMQMEEIADQSGGTMFTATRAEDLADAYDRVATELRQLYSLAYDSAADANSGKWRNIKVEVARPDSTARTRRGYYSR
ncbi:MAG: VWA domain-containing protein [Blastocatellia bacterium]